MLKCSVCWYTERLKDLKCAIKKIKIHTTMPSGQIKELTAKITVKYQISIAELRKSIKSCLCEIKSSNFQCTQLTSISNDITKLKSPIFSDIKLLVCLKCYLGNFNMFDENVCRFRRFIFWSIPGLKTLQSSIQNTLVTFNKDIQEKSKELENVECKITEMEKCVKKKLDSLNKTLITGIRINGFNIKHEMTVECTPPKLTDDEFYKKYKCCLLKENTHLKNIISDVDKLKFEDSVEKIKRGASSICELLFKRYVQCSLQSLSTHLIKHQDIGILEINNLLIGVMSGIVIDESIFVVSRLYTYYKTKDLIDETLRILQGCLCLKIYKRDWSDKIETFDKPNNANIKTWNEQMIIDILDHIRNKSRYVCLCIFVRFILLYDLYKINNKCNEIYMDLLSCMSRNYKKYSYSMKHKLDLSKLIMLIIITLDKIIRWMITKLVGYNNCFCYDVNNSYYPYLISIILFVSSLVENIWTIDSESVRLSIECLSKMINEFEMIDSHNNKPTNNNSSTVFNDIINVIVCKPDVCKLSSKLQLIWDLITLSKRVSVLESVIKPYFPKILLTNPDLFYSDIHSLSTNNSVNDSVKTYLQWVLKKYKSIDSGENICRQFKNQCCVLSSNSVIILGVLISYIIKSKLYSGKCQQLKDNLCASLKLVCNCNSSDCCLKQILGSTDQICTGRGNNCDDLLKKCVDSCCVKECCKGGCPCKEIKDSCVKLKNLSYNIGKNGLLMSGYSSPL